MPQNESLFMSICNTFICSCQAIEMFLGRHFRKIANSLLPNLLAKPSLRRGTPSCRCTHVCTYVCLYARSSPVPSWEVPEDPLQVQPIPSDTLSPCAFMAQHNSRMCSKLKEVWGNFIFLSLLAQHSQNQQYYVEMLCWTEVTFFTQQTVQETDYQHD